MKHFSRFFSIFLPIKRFNKKFLGFYVTFFVLKRCTGKKSRFSRLWKIFPSFSVTFSFLKRYYKQRGKNCLSGTGLRERRQSYMYLSSLDKTKTVEYNIDDIDRIICYY